MRQFGVLRTCPYRIRHRLERGGEFLGRKIALFRNFASHILPVLTFATLLVGTALVGVALTRIPQRPTDAAPPSPAPETSYIAAGSLTGRTILVDPGHGGYDGGARCVIPACGRKRSTSP